MGWLLFIPAVGVAAAALVAVVVWLAACDTGPQGEVDESGRPGGRVAAPQGFRPPGATARRAWGVGWALPRAARRRWCWPGCWGCPGCWGGEGNPPGRVLVTAPGRA